MADDEAPGEQRVTLSSLLQDFQRIATPRHAAINVARVYDRDEDDMDVDDPPRLRPMLVTPAMMSALLDGLALFAARTVAPFGERDDFEAYASLNGREIIVERETSDLPPMLSHEMEVVIGDQYGEAKVVTDAQDRVVYDDVRVAAERGHYRMRTLENAVAHYRRHYNREEIERAEQLPRISFSYLVVDLKHVDMLPRLMPGFYFLVVPRDPVAVYPHKDQWRVAKPFIMGIDYAELEAVGWHERRHERTQGNMRPSLVERHSASGVIKGTRVIPGRVTSDAERSVIGIHSDYTDKVTLFARHNQHDVTFIQHASGQPNDQIHDVWEERVAVSRLAWEQQATARERDAQRRREEDHETLMMNTRLIGVSRVRTTLPPPTYMSVAWHLVLLGDEKDALSRETFWAREIAFNAYNEPAVVPEIPEAIDVSSQVRPIVTREEFITGEFIARIRATFSNA